EHIDRAARILAPELDVPLTELLFAEVAPGEQEPLEQTGYTQPALFALEVALCEMLRSWGVRPAAVAGHSVGELTAAWAAGVLGLEDALRLVARRGALMQSLPPDGAMAAVLAGEAVARERIAALGVAADVACINGPVSTVVSGPREELERLAAGCRELGIGVRRLKVSHAFHSHLMEPILPQLAAAVAEVSFAAPTLDLPTNLTGAAEPSRIASPDYWVEQARQPVRFEKMVGSLAASGCDLLVEVGPHPTLIGLARRLGGESSPRTLATLRRGAADWEQIAETVARCYQEGVHVDWAGFDADYNRRRLCLPTYPFETRRLWAEVGTDGRTAAAGGEPRPGAGHLGAGRLEQLLESGDLAGLQQLVSPEDAAQEPAAAVLRALDSLVDLHHADRGSRSRERLLYRAEWVPAGPAGRRSGVSRPAAGVWLVFADQGGIGERMAQRLTRGGDRCVLIRASRSGAFANGEAWEISPLTREHYSRLADGIRSAVDEAELAGILYCWGLDLAPSPCDPDLAIDAVMPPLIMTSLAGLFASSRRRALWMVTRGAQAAGGTVIGEGGLMQSPLWGVGRTLAMELPELWGGIVDLSRQPEDAELDALEAVVRGLGGDEDQLALRGVEHYVARLAAAPTGGGAGELELSNRGVYLITGGLGALGLETARWLAARGAREILMLGRSAPDEGTRATVRLIEDLGAGITIAACDVADAESLDSVLSELRGRGGVIAGVIHAAGVAGYQPLESLDVAAVRRVMAAKVRGGWLLHQAVARDEIDFFLSYSSIAATWGSKHQAHYAAANTFLDALARFRIGAGLPAHSIAWGPWEGGGMAAEAEQYARMGLRTLPARPSTEILRALVAEGSGEWVVADLDWRLYLSMLEARRRRPFFSRFASEDEWEPGAGEGSEAPASSSFREQLAALPADERADFTAELVARRAGRVLGVDGARIEHDRGFFDLGMDSIMVVELVEELRKDTGLALSYATVFEHACVETICVHLLGRIYADEVATDPDAPTASLPAEGGPTELVAEIAALDDEQLRSFINAEVDNILKESHR
ncbi:MAG: SDR family NAD(P)-dependent oxidoreductase, partial [bacterium]|nr:SDR family NAD(P)-dependent oxidoreductase [bacterium]